MSELKLGDFVRFKDRRYGNITTQGVVQSMDEKFVHCFWQGTAAKTKLCGPYPIVPSQLEKVPEDERDKDMVLAFMRGLFSGRIVEQEP